VQNLGPQNMKAQMSYDLAVTGGGGRARALSAARFAIMSVIR